MVGSVMVGNPLWISHGFGWVNWLGGICIGLACNR